MFQTPWRGPAGPVAGIETLDWTRICKSWGLGEFLDILVGGWLTYHWLVIYCLYMVYITGYYMVNDGYLYICLVVQ